MHRIRGSARVDYVFFCPYESSTFSLSELTVIHSIVAALSYSRKGFEISQNWTDNTYSIPILPQLIYRITLNFCQV